MKTKLKKPDLLTQCMNCKHYRGQHNVVTKVICNWKPTSAEMNFRQVNLNGTVDCPKLLWGMKWDSNN